MEATPSRHVFISFASADLELAHRAVETLEVAGLKCWISDRNIDPATSYPAAITAAVKECGVLLLLLTESSNRSRHVLREVEMAFNARRPVLPVRVARVNPSSDLQYFLSTSQWLDAGTAFDHEDLARIEPRLRELLAGVTIGGETDTGGERRRRLLIAGGVAAVIAVAIAAYTLWGGRSEGGIAPTSPAGDRGLTTALVPAAGPGNTIADGNPTTSGPAVKVNPRDGQTYAWIAPGQLLMGCSTGDPECEDDEKPVHAVDIKRGFWLSRTEITEAQYQKAVPQATTGEGRESNLPVTAVSWSAAKTYCAAVGGRLPTEAEWEFAARAGTSTRFYGSLPAIAWFEENSEEHSHPVGMKAPNAFGLHDMLGNAAEWVLDRYYNTYDDTTDPTTVEEPLAGNASGVARGGSWVSEPAGVRVSRRLAMPPDAEEPFIGFRCAVDEL